MPESTSAKIQKINVLRYFRSTLILALVTLLLIVFAGLFTVRVARVEGPRVAVKLHNRSGQIEVIDQPGTYIYNGIFSSFYILDKTVQTIDMTSDPNRGDRQGRDDLRIKTVDGSNVALDLVVQYKMLPDKVEEIVTGSGLDDAYKLKWIRDYSRSICRTTFGELTTEEFYDSRLRASRALAAEAKLNELLNPHGIQIVKVIDKEYRFHEEYRKKIDLKKQADQDVEALKSEANAAVQSQAKQIVQATKKKDVEIATYDGEMTRRVVDTTGQAMRRTEEAEAYAVEVRLGAEAEFFQREQNAQAIRAKMTAEAEALEKMASALSGEGGRNIVRLEYAQRLQSMKIAGQPFTVNGQTERFTHIEEGGAATRRPAPKTP